MRVGAEYQARIPDFEPGKSLFGCNLTSCRRRSRGGRDGFGAGVGSAGRSPGGGRGVVFILLSSLCVGDPVPAAGGWQGQRLLSVRPGAGGGGGIAVGNSRFIISRIMCLRREAVKQKEVDAFFLLFSFFLLKP